MTGVGTAVSVRSACGLASSGDGVSSAGTAGFSLKRDAGSSFSFFGSGRSCSGAATTLPIRSIGLATFSVVGEKFGWSETKR